MVLLTYGSVDCSKENGALGRCAYLTRVTHHKRTLVKDTSTELQPFITDFIICNLCVCVRHACSDLNRNLSITCLQVNLFFSINTTSASESSF